MTNQIHFRDFEDYLGQIFAEGDGNCVLDDEFPDAFNEWVCELEPDDFFKYADKYAKLCDAKIVKAVNCHDELVELLTETRKYLDDGDYPENADQYALSVLIDHVLKKAGEL